MSKNFEPYIDWDSFDDEMLGDLAKAFDAFRAAQSNFDTAKTKENAVALLKAQMEISDIASAVHSTLFTVPMMVHIAGARTSGQDEDGRDELVQRCSRCGSVLQQWKTGYMAVTPAGPLPLEEDDIPWFDPGAIVAKSGDENESMTVYEIPKDQELDKHERECLDLRGLVS